MKFFASALLLSIGLCSFKTPSLVKPLKLIQIDEYATDTNGGRHHIHGWIDVSFFPPKINHWDIYYDNTHFQGVRADNPDPESAQVIQPEAYGESMMTESDYQLINDRLEENLNMSTTVEQPEG